MSLGNVLAVAYATKREKLTFLEEEDKVGAGWLRLGARLPGPAQGQSPALVLASTLSCR